MTPIPESDQRYYLTEKGWAYAGYARCVGAHGRSCPVSIRADKPSGRCEFCERTLRLPDTREAVA